MKTSVRGIELLKELEGFRSNVYFDSAGLPTIGYGTLIDSADEKKYLTSPITEQEAENLLMRDVARTENEIQYAIKTTLKQCQFDALVIFAYNIGTNRFRGSTLLKMVNKDRDDVLIRIQFHRWIYAGGKTVEGLKNRRKREADLYFSE